MRVRTTGNPGKEEKTTPMAVMRVKPDQNGIDAAQKKMQVARRGYKLLKDKRD